MPLAKKLPAKASWKRLVPWGALLPMALTVLVGYLGTALWSLRVSLSSARTFPQDDFVGLAQYERLFDNDRWLHSLGNLAIYGLGGIIAPFIGIKLIDLVVSLLPGF